MRVTEFLLARIAEDAEGAGRERVLAECEAKLALIADLAGYCWQNHRRGEPCGTCDRIGCRNLRVMASVYADHPDYRPEWKL